MASTQPLLSMLKALSSNLAKRKTVSPTENFQPLAFLSHQHQLNEALLSSFSHIKVLLTNTEQFLNGHTTVLSVLRVVFREQP